jgi:TM2 domain-containing membrane protein YozV
MLNQLINIFWTMASFAVFGIYWGLYLAEKRSPLVLIAFVVISVLVYAIPARWLSILTLGKNRKFYERIGIKLFRYFVQNGTLVNRIQRKFTAKSGIIHNLREARNYLRTIAMQERFHYCCFILFSLSTVDAFYIGKPGMALLIILFNILYNAYPILLQQYNRLRINLVLLNSPAS